MVKSAQHKLLESMLTERIRKRAATEFLHAAGFGAGGLHELTGEPNVWRGDITKRQSIAFAFSPRAYCVAITYEYKTAAPKNNCDLDSLADVVEGIAKNSGLVPDISWTNSGALVVKVSTSRINYATSTAKCAQIAEAIGFIRTIMDAYLNKSTRARGG